MRVPTAHSGELVSVVIPAYNAKDTIEETLISVKAQSHANLEIIIVDDGSTDLTGEIAAASAAADPSIRIIHQANAGVAAARNAGWRAAASDLIAFVDADDLWAPDKIERQLHALYAGGPLVGLVYTWYVLIDVYSIVTEKWDGPYWKGKVLDILMTNNFVGNGSSALVRRKALEDADGFEAGLRTAGAQGCEDILFYARVAEHHDFAVVPDHLVGYRFLPDNMSSDLPKMLRSWTLMIDELEARHPEKRHQLMAGLKHFSTWLVRRAIGLRQFDQIAPLVRTAARRSPRIAAWIIAVEIPRASIDFGRRRIRLQRWRPHQGAPKSSPALDVQSGRFAAGTHYLAPPEQLMV